MKRISYITVVNEHFEPLLQQLIKSHQMFSRIDLTVYTINFEIENKNYNNINFIKMVDENLLEFDSTGKNKYIKNEYEKHKYSTLMKPKILKNFLDSYDYYFFIDADILLTKNSDTLVINTINEFGFSKFPISVKYFHQYSDTHNPVVPIFNENGDFNPESLGHYPLIELYNTEFNDINYISTYCLYYTRECFDFIDEVEKICFDENVIIDYDKFLPLGDETVFNYLYSKYNFNESISNYLCYDINPFMGINTLLPNLEKIKNFVSFIHTKRYITFTPYEKKFNNIRFDEYNQIFDLLLQKESINSNTNIVSIDNHFDSNMITFNVNNNYSDYFKVILVSLFRPNKEYVYFMNLYDNVNYFIIKEKDVWIKDLHLIVESNKIIHDCTKIT
jgi:hypothetical protein